MDVQYESTSKPRRLSNRHFFIEAESYSLQPDLAAESLIFFGKEMVPAIDYPFAADRLLARNDAEPKARRLFFALAYEQFVAASGSARKLDSLLE